MEAMAGTSKATYISITRRELVDVSRSCSSNNFKDKCDKVYEYVKKHIACDELPKEQIQKLRHFTSQFKIKWDAAARVYDKFCKKNQSWLDTKIEFSVQKMGNKSGRPSLEFIAASERSKRRKTESLRNNFSSSELTYAAQMQLRKEQKLDAANVVKDIISMPQSAMEYKEAKKKMNIDIKPYLSDEALSMVVEAKLTKYQYNIIRDTAKKHNSNMYPNYEAITAARKRCYPENILITESHAEVPLQCLLDHTVTRLLQVQEKVINTLQFDQLNNITLIVKWGCDGTSGISQFKQKFEDNNVSDSSIFTSSLVPLQLISGNINSKEKIILWQNSRPSSPRFCRPIRIKYVHETMNVILEEVKSIEKEIQILNPTIAEINNVKISIKHKCLFTMIDGKVCNAVSDNPATQRCYLCQLTCKDFNKLALVLQQNIEDKTKLRFGISPLHAWIRFFECLLHLSYKSTICQWQARGEENKRKVLENKRKVQEGFKTEMGLLVDRPKPGFGTTNDGNTARRFFENSSLSAKITGVDEEIIKRFHVILIVISSTYRIKINLLKNYCLETAEIFVRLYPWYNMPTTVHKILLHCADIIEHAILPIGQLGEEAQEARNKDIKLFRERYSRKFSRKETMEDIFHNLLVSSDPFISSMKTPFPKKTKKFPPDVFQFFDVPDTREATKREVEK